MLILCIKDFEMSTNKSLFFMLILCIKDFEMSTNNQYFDYFSVFKVTFSTH